MRRPASRLALLVVVVAALAPAAGALGPVAAPAAAAADLVTVVEATGTASPGDTAGQRAFCPLGTRVVGSGVAGTALPLAYRGAFFVDRLPDDGRSNAVVLAGNVGAQEHPFTAYALCLPASVGVSYEAASRVVGAGSALGVTVACPDGTRRVAGAGAVFSVLDVPPATLTGGHPAAGGWTARAANRASGAGEARLHAEASCVDGRVLVRDVQAAGVRVRPGGRTSRHLTCPAGWEVAGGGFRLPSLGSSLAVTASRPEARSGREGWVVTVANNGAAEASFDAHAACVRSALR